MRTGINSATIRYRPRHTTEGYIQLRDWTERSFRFEVALPRELSCDAFRLLLNGNEAEASCRDGHAAFEADGKPGGRIEWEVVSFEGG